jgi:hypothetical protein
MDGESDEVNRANFASLDASEEASSRGMSRDRCGLVPGADIDR